MAAYRIVQRDINYNILKTRKLSDKVLHHEFGYQGYVEGNYLVIRSAAFYNVVLMKIKLADNWHRYELVGAEKND